MTTNNPTIRDALTALNSALEILQGVELNTAPNETLGQLGVVLKALGEFRTNALDNEILRRNLNGEQLPGVVVKDAVTQRKWNDEETASELAFAQFGLKAFKLCGPAAVEKLGDEGKALVAAGSFKPVADKKQVVY